MRAHTVAPRVTLVGPSRPAPRGRGTHFARTARGARSFRPKAHDKGGDHGHEPVVLAPLALAEDALAPSERDPDDGLITDPVTRADATAEASTNPGLPSWAAGIAVSVAASAVVTLGVGVVPNGGDATSASPVSHATGTPSGTTCGNFSSARTRVARDILTCNQDNWRENCLAHYTEDLRYVDGPGLTNVRGKQAMATYLRNQFAFSNQWLTVTDETCAGDTYIATWSLDMDLGTGNLVDMPGISVLKFAEETGDGNGDGYAAGDTAGDGNAGDGSAVREPPQLVRYHRDYLPDGKIWEQAPVVGPLVKFQRETYVGCMLSPRGCAELLGAPK